MLNEIVQPLISWYRQNKRILPWRDQKNAYYTWVSEIMLQQTRVEAVKRYYARFLEKLPTIEALAECEEEILLKLWEGLGYYNRVKNMQKAAKVIVEKYAWNWKLYGRSNCVDCIWSQKACRRWKCAKGSGKAGRVGKRYCKDVNEKRS